MRGQYYSEELQTGLAHVGRDRRCMSSLGGTNKSTRRKMRFGLGGSTMAKSVTRAWGLRPKLTARQKHWLDKLSAVEPKLTLAELSSRLGEPYATVQRWTSFFGYPIRDGRTE